MKNIFLVLAVVFPLGVNAQSWVRQVSNDFVVKDEKSDLLVFFSGENLVCPVKKESSFDYDGKSFNCDCNGNSLDRFLPFSSRRDLDSLDVRQIIDSCYVRNDTLFIAIDSVFDGCRIINQGKNILYPTALIKNALNIIPFDSIAITDSLDMAGSILRLAPIFSASRVLPLSEVKVEIVEPEFIVTNDDQSSSDTSIPWKFVILILASVLAVAFCFLWILSFTGARRKASEYEHELKKIKQEKDNLLSSGSSDQALLSEIAKLRDENAELRRNQENGNSSDLVNKEIKELKGKISGLEDALSSKKKEFSDKIEEEKSRSEKVLSDLKEKHSLQIKDFRERLDKEITDATNKLNEAQAKAEKELSAVKNKYNAEVASLKEQHKGDLAEYSNRLTAVSAELTTEKANSSALSSKLAETSDMLRIERNNVARLTDEQKVYTEKVIFVNEAQLYAAKVMKLIELSRNICSSAESLMDRKIGDNYRIVKALAKFEKTIGEINMVDFYNDVRMVSKHGLIFSDSSLASVNKNTKDTNDDSIRLYFFTCYLEKYVEAVVVLNESMAGVHKFIEELSPSDTETFLSFRDRINALAEDLSLDIASVKLFDYTGDNVDLDVQYINAGNFDSSAILAIENCYVFPKGGKRPARKIKVIAQI